MREQAMALSIAARSAVAGQMRASEAASPPLVTPEACARCEAREVSVCSVLSGDDLARLSHISVVSTVGEGETFITEGDPADHFFNITAGTAKLYKLLPDGRCQVTGFARTGDFLGLAAGAVYVFSAEALEPVRFCRFARSKLRGFLRDCPEMERRLLDLARNELVLAQEQMLLLGRKRARERLASFLLSWQQRAAPGPGNRLMLPMTRTDIADYLGLTIETISRTLSAFKKTRLIAQTALSELIILNGTELAAIAAGDR
jgi:CRP/FNR family transcriptional regulator